MTISLSLMLLSTHALAGGAVADNLAHRAHVSDFCGVVRAVAALKLPSSWYEAPLIFQRSHTVGGTRHQDLVFRNTREIQKRRLLYVEMDDRGTVRHLGTIPR